MEKYYTEIFNTRRSSTISPVSIRIDEWLNSFSKKEPFSLYNWEIIAYTSCGLNNDDIIITIRVVDNLNS